MDKVTAFSVPGWVPEGAWRYLAHTQAGRSIRDLARTAGCHASTVMRQIRRMEMRRDDPLVDAALDALASAHFARATGRNYPGAVTATVEPGPAEVTPDTDTFDREALRVLRRMCESGAVLAVAEDMDKAVVVRDDGAGGSARTAVVDCAIAQALALKDWIACDKPGRISRYHITAAGRAALGQLVARTENLARVGRASGFADAQTPFRGPGEMSGEAPDGGQGRSRRVRYGIAESPLIALARRKDRDGRPFLDESLVRAGERLREDFELAQMGPKVAQNWDSFLTGGGRDTFGPGPGPAAGPADARDRVAQALADLGPGLSDVALRCCCYLEGLELAEKRMGWSARSGKIVLRIALQRLKRHYDDRAGCARMIG